MRPAGGKPRHPSHSNLKERGMDWERVVSRLDETAVRCANLAEKERNANAALAALIFSGLREALEAGLEQE